MTTKKEVTLGCAVRDSITGFTGIAYQLVELLSGTVQYAVQPSLAPVTKTCPQANGIPDAINFDVQLLEYVGDGVSSRAQQPEATVIRLGHEVEDLATGVKGTVTSRHTFLNGCVYFHIQPKQSKDQKDKGVVPDLEFVDCKRLKKIGDGLAKKVEPVLAKPVSERSGGPMTRSARI